MNPIHQNHAFLPANDPVPSSGNAKVPVWYDKQPLDEYTGEGRKLVALSNWVERFNAERVNNGFGQLSIMCRGILMNNLREHSIYKNTHSELPEENIMDRIEAAHRAIYRCNR